MYYVAQLVSFLFTESRSGVIKAFHMEDWTWHVDFDEAHERSENGKLNLNATGTCGQQCEQPDHLREQSLLVQ